MWQTLDGRYRYEIANEVLIDLVNNVLPEEAPFALRVFGNREAEVCRSDLEVSLAPLDPAAVAAVIADIEPKPFGYAAGGVHPAGRSGPGWRQRCPHPDPDHRRRRIMRRRRGGSNH